MRRLWILALCFVTLACSLPLGGGASAYTTGSYKAAAMGFGGLVEVTVDTDESGITGVHIVGDSETPSVGQAAFDALIQAIIESQSADISAVSGATLTSNAVMEAASQALAMSNGDSVQAAGTTFRPGVYTVTETGVEPFTVAFTFTESALSDIEVIDHHESFNTGSVALEALSQRALTYQTANLDAISGATVTSAAFCRALTAAVQEAGGNIHAFYEEIVDDREYADEQADVVIVGTGWAGMCAAQTAFEAGLNAIVLEKNGMIGGVSMGTNHIYGYDTIAQQEKGIEVTEEDLLNAMQRLAGNQARAYADINGVDFHDDKGLEIYVHESHDLINWLLNLGVDIRFDVPGDIGAHANTNRQDYSAGGETMTARMKELYAQEGLDLRLENRAVELLTQGDSVIGVAVETASGKRYNIYAQAVVLCTGGFYSNAEMVAQYFTHFPALPTDARSGSDGSGIQMAQAVGAKVANLDMGSLFPFALNRNDVYYDVFAKPYILGGGFTINENGERFGNELASYLNASRAVLAQPGSHCYILCDEAAKNAATADYPSHLGYINEHYLDKYDTLEELAEAYNFDYDTLQATVDHYAELVKRGEDSDYGRPAPTLTTTMEEGPYYILDTQPVLHTTWGGIVIDYDSRVLRDDGSAISGLYAAGECCNLFGMGANPATEACVYGRRAIRAIISDFDK